MTQIAEPVETAELLAFAKTVESKSLSRAAAELGAPRATISRRLARLEERLGARLLRRTTRSLVLTDAGEAFYRHARIVLDAVGAAEASVRRADDRIRGDLRVSVPPMLNESFASMVARFSEAHPLLRVHLHFSTQFVDLVRGGYDVAIRAGTELEPGLVARTLAKEPLFAVASPAYLEAHGAPKSVKDLKHHRCLMGFQRGELPQTHWPLASGGKVHVDGVFFSNEVGLLAYAAREGLGVAMLPLLLIRGALERGELVRVLPSVLTAESRVSVVWAEREFVAPQVRAFVDAVVAWAPNELGRHVPERCAREEKRRR